MMPHRKKPAIPNTNPTRPTPAARPRSQGMRVSAATASRARAERQEALGEIEQVVGLVMALVVGVVPVRGVGQLLQLALVALDLLAPPIDERPVLGRVLEDAVAEHGFRAHYFEVELELAHALRLVLVPAIDRQRLRALDRLHNVVVLDLGDGEKGGDQGDDDRDGVVEAVAFPASGGFGWFRHRRARGGCRYHHGCFREVHALGSAIHRFRGRAAASE